MPFDPPSPSGSEKCPNCGAPLPEQAPQGLCPKCLFAGLAVPTEAGDLATPTPTLTPEQLAPHFPQLEILECLGRGGMGVVYKARQKSLNRLVALKLLAPERVTDAKFAERFAREAQALAALNHPHIVTVHDFGVVDAVPPPSGGAGENAPVPHARMFFLLMEFVDGVNLRQAMKAGRFTPEQALAVVPPVCDALQYAHEHGIVHRDIKPENLLLDKEGRVKIADFGIAKILGDATPDAGGAESQPAGTPQYMAPEQKAHRATDHRTDIYSLGVVLYELLTGELPADKLQPPSRKVQIDVRLDEIVLRALEKTPELRYQTAGEFRTQVDTIIGRPTRAELPDSERPLAQRKASVWSNWLPYLGLLTLLAGLWWTYLWRHDPVEGRLMRPVGAAVTVVGLFLMLKGLLQGARNSAAHSLPAKPVNTWRSATPDRSSQTSTPSRLSRTAIVGACWAPFFFIAFVAMKTSYKVEAGHYNGPSWWQIALMVTLLPLGVTAPFGTTILGWIAVSQIRRSAGKLYGLGLALFDGLLFPLLGITGLVAWFWRWIFLDLFYPRAIDALVPDGPAVTVSRFEAFVFEHWMALIILCTFVTAGSLCVLIIRAVLRAANPPPADPAAPRSANAAPPPQGTGWRKARIGSVIALLIAIPVRLFLLGPFVVTGDSAAPELPAGSRILVWKPARAFSPGDMIAYDHGGDTFVGRVVGAAEAFVTVNRNGQPDEIIPRQRVTGKVISVYWRATSPVASRHPHGSHISRGDHSVLVSQDDGAVHYVFYTEGDFGTTTEVSQNTRSVAWVDRGSLLLTGGSTLGYYRESIFPDTLSVNGREIDLRRGRVLAVHGDGTVEQLRIFPTRAAANAPEELAKLIASARAMNDEPITAEKLRQQLEATEAQLGDALKTCAPTHPFVIEVRETIEMLKKKIGAQTRQAVDAAATFGPVIEREIPFGRACLNLVTGILTPLPGMALAAQARQLHGDVFQPATESNTNALAILDARVLDLDEAAWTHLSATALEEKFAQDAASRRTSQGLSQTRIPPGVYGFKTHDKTGLLQVLGMTGPTPGQFSGVMFRYKLVQPATNGPASPAETHRAILKAELQQARAAAAELEAKLKLGVATPVELSAAEDKIEIMEAELKGDLVQVARVGLLAAKRKLEDALKNLELGIATLLDCEKAKGEVAIAEAKLREAEAKAGQQKDGGGAADAFEPVIEREMNDLQTSRENCSLSFDSGKLLPLAANITPDMLSPNRMKKPPAPGVAEAWVRAQEEALTWARTQQVDAVAFVTTEGGKLVKCGLLCPQVLAIRSENSAWDSATPALLRKEFDREMSEWRFIPQVAEASSDGQFPATYLLLDTRTHRMGVLQITGGAENPARVKIRYKLVRGAAGKATVVVAAITPAVFGPPMESVLPFGAPCERLVLQFRTGRLFVNGHGPGTTKEQAEADWKIIDEAGGVDAQAYALEDGLQLDGEGCVFLRMERPGWDEATAADVASFLKHGSMIGLLEIRLRKGLPVSAFFKTARGEMGLLQVLEIVDDGRGYHGDGKKGHGVKLRYKLVQAGGAKSAAAPTPKPPPAVESPQPTKP
jgi:serine/threonine protein kinase/signal peptidase I